MTIHLNVEKYDPQKTFNELKPVEPKIADIYDVAKYNDSIGIEYTIKNDTIYGDVIRFEGQHDFTGLDCRIIANCVWITNCHRLERIDLYGTIYNILALTQNFSLKEYRVDANIRNLFLRDCISLESLPYNTIEGLYVHGCTKLHEKYGISERNLQCFVKHGEFNLGDFNVMHGQTIHGWCNTGFTGINRYYVANKNLTNCVVEVYMQKAKVEPDKDFFATLEVSFIEVKRQVDLLRELSSDYEQALS